MPLIRFKSELHKPPSGSGVLVILPGNASAKLPSRGMAIAEGTVNGVQFRAILEPDGQGSHWFKIDRAMSQAAGINAGGTASLALEPSKAWPEPELGKDLKAALDADPQAWTAWKDITPMARWDWLNWMDSVKLAETRRERPQKLISMLKAGKRRPCCFNRTLRMAPKSAEPL